MSFLDFLKREDGLWADGSELIALFIPYPDLGDNRIPELWMQQGYFY